MDIGLRNEIIEIVSHKLTSEDYDSRSMKLQGEVAANYEIIQKNIEIEQDILHHQGKYIA